MNEPFIRQKGGQLFTTSIDVAEKFGKRHDHVLVSVRKIIDSDGAFGLPNFRESSYLNDQNKKQPMFEMTRSGFTILAMGFSGKKALEWKIKYEQAFSAMEQALVNQQNLSWQDQRRQGKIARREVTDTIQAFIAYAELQGSRNARHYYSHITKATYSALFIVKDQGGKSFRDLLDSMQLNFLTTAEYIAAKAIEDGMASGLYYKDIYRLAKERIEAVAVAMPKTQVISCTLVQRLPFAPQSAAIN